MQAGCGGSSAAQSSCTQLMWERGKLLGVRKGDLAAPQHSRLQSHERAQEFVSGFGPVKALELAAVPFASCESLRILDGCGPARLARPLFAVPSRILFHSF